MDNKQTGRAKHLATALIALIAGFVGSAVHGWLANRSAGVVRASRFEVVGAGKVLSYWGPDANPQLPSSTPQGTLLVFFDNGGRARVVMGSRSGDLGPELDLNDRHGQGRFELALADGDDPIMAFRTPFAWRIMLGAIHGDVADDKSTDDWGLRFHTAGDAGMFIGTHAVNPTKPQAFVSVRDQEGIVWTMPPKFTYEIEGVPLVPRRSR